MAEKTCPACGNKDNVFYTRDCDVCDCPLEASPSQDEKRIYQEVAKRRKRAKELGLPDLFGKLYHDEIKHYPGWFEHNPEHVCSLVTEAQDVTDVSELDKIIIKLNGHEYRLEFKEYKFSTPDNVSCSNGNLVLYSGDRKVLDVSMHIRYDYEEEHATPKWGTFEPVSFIEGDWVRDFKELEKRIPIEDAARERRNAEAKNKENVQKMKEDFGL